VRYSARTSDVKKGDRIIVAVTFFDGDNGGERRVMFMDVCVKKVSGDRIWWRGGDYPVHTGKELSVANRGISWAFAHREKEVAALKVAATLIM
jgi:hypothetical protein